MLNRKILRKLVARIAGKSPPRICVLKLSGVIGPPSRMGESLSLDRLGPTLERAFEAQGIKAVALAINSPGGTAAQSMLIHQRIRALAQEKNLPVFAFTEDVAASGGYMLACAADEIFASEGSILGSIGVISASFGFERLIEKVGVERRLYTAGTRKSLLDPFLPVDTLDVERLKSVQSDMHDSFKSMVRTRRGNRLKGDDEHLFSGEFWTGTRAVALGLADGIADLRSEMRRRYGQDVEFKWIAPPSRQRFVFWRNVSLRQQAASIPWGDLAEDVLARIEARAIWARFGL